jgi:hypothetical protein
MQFGLASLAARVVGCAQQVFRQVLQPLVLGFLLRLLCRGVAQPVCGHQSI